jgi:hypothetical protein
VTWHCKKLGDGASASAPSRRIQQLFSPMYLARGRPSDMAVFSHHDRQADEVTAYFSPAAEKLAALFGAHPCEKPGGERMGLLVGDARCWSILFPEKRRRAA